MRIADRIAVAILASFPAFGVLDVFTQDLVFVHVVLLAVLGFAWCKADVRDRGIFEPLGSAILIGATGVIGVPIYLFRSRPMGRAIRSTLLFLGFFAACIVSYLAAALVTELLSR